MQNKQSEYLAVKAQIKTHKYQDKHQIDMTTWALHKDIFKQNTSLRLGNKLTLL